MYPLNWTVTQWFKFKMSIIQVKNSLANISWAIDRDLNDIVKAVDDGYSNGYRLK